MCRCGFGRLLTLQAASVLVEVPHSALVWMVEATPHANGVVRNDSISDPFSNPEI